MTHLGTQPHEVSEPKRGFYVLTTDGYAMREALGVTSCDHSTSSVASKETKAPRMQGFRKSG